MKFLHLTETDHNFHECMNLYNNEFDYEIREPVEVFDQSFNIKKKDEQRYHFIAAYEDDTLQGFIAFHLEITYRIGYIVYLVVSPKARGKQIARMLMTEAEEVMVKLCENNGTSLAHIILECEKNSEGISPLDAFYKKFGFSKTDYHYHQPGLHNDDPVPMNLYLKTSDKQRVKPAIEHIYRVKYIQCNQINPEQIEQLIAMM
ncbi:GNAT family N-acetyltransferase [Macrococcoides caseolyticum]|uniref:GNAT family N-acetyltransferase n=1 Tax=Macrococcoides caseolyticum TaxID=69966 RepID=UPI001F294847|nr:GNAT family N-acetyltransferase [Macrococcus caseolyticus]MCE4956712.1 GNAT family N-acetyltransferase [Macrococcus caseolyticus]